MTNKEFQNLKIGDFIFKGKRMGKVTGKETGRIGLVYFEYLDTKRKSYRIYRALQLPLYAQEKP